MNSFFLYFFPILLCDCLWRCVSMCVCVFVCFILFVLISFCCCWILLSFLHSHFVCCCLCLCVCVFVLFISFFASVTLLWSGCFMFCRFNFSELINRILFLNATHVRHFVRLFLSSVFFFQLLQLNYLHLELSTFVSPTAPPSLYGTCCNLFMFIIVHFPFHSLSLSLFLFIIFYLTTWRCVLRKNVWILQYFLSLGCFIHIVLR